MTTLDLRKQYKHLYQPSAKWAAAREKMKTVLRQGVEAI